MMKRILYLVDETLADVAGPLNAIIRGWKTHMPSDYEIVIVKMPVSFKRRNSKKILREKRAEILGKIDEKTKAIIIHTNTISYYAYPLIAPHTNSIKMISYIADCNARACLTQIKATKGVNKYKIEKIIKLLVSYYKEYKIVREYPIVLYITKQDLDYSKMLYKGYMRAVTAVFPYGIELPNHDINNYKRVNGKLRIGTICIFNKHSVYEYFYELLNVLASNRQKLHQKIEFVVAGRNATQDQIDYLRKFDFVRFIGEIESLRDFYDHVDIVISTVKKQAGVLTKIVEAFAYRKCVMGFEHNFESIEGAVPYVNYIPVKDYIGFIPALNKVIDNTFDIEKIGNNAYLIAKEKYSWETFFGKLIRCIEEDI